MTAFAPKNYQRRALTAWAEFTARLAGGIAVADAFATVTERFLDQRRTYLPPPCLGSAPAVCLRIPTGGGKTWLAAAACGIAAGNGLIGAGRDQGADSAASRAKVVVWLVPSTEIAQQTLRNLRDPRHPCRDALVAGAGGHVGLGTVRVMDDTEALSLTPGDIQAGAVVVVATIQNFRVDDTGQRAVYRQNGQLMGHGLAEPNLAAVLARYRPLIVVDEAHNARTDRSFDALGRLNPASVLEITATPTREGGARLPANVLVEASAFELHAEQMLKLPIELAVHASPDHCLGLALRRRADLERLATAETVAGAPYLRPLLLIQAMAKKKGEDDRLTPEVVKRKLIEDHGVGESAIRIATGSVRELDNIAQEFPRGLADPACPVTTIITVEALREGWDCPSAYVLCTLKGSFTDTAAAQIIGRVLRQPDAIRRRSEDLNRAYAVAATQDFAGSLGQLRDALVGELGYEREQAEAATVAASTTIAIPLALEAPVTLPPGTPLIAARIAALPEPTRAKLGTDAATGALTVATMMTGDEIQQVAACIDDGPTAVTFAFALRSACDRSATGNAGAPLFAPVCPAERGLLFAVPQILLGRQQSLLDITDTVLTDRDWTLDERLACLDAETYTPGVPRFVEGELDIDRAGRVITRLCHGEDALALFPPESNAARLAQFVLSHLHAEDIHFDDLARWVLTAIDFLLRQRRVDLGQLEVDQWNLARTLDARIELQRTTARRTAVQELLFSGTAALRKSPPHRHFRFDPTTYPVSEIEREVKFRKHYYRYVAAMNSEERACAMALDDLPEVLTWVRNLEREPHAFRLPRSPGRSGRWFYPDFVALLTDGRTLVVEYKGVHLVDSVDTDDKVAAGQLWERTTGGLFVLVPDQDYQAIARHLAAHPVPAGIHPGWPPGFAKFIDKNGPGSDLGDIEPMRLALGDGAASEWTDAP